MIDRAATPAVPSRSRTGPFLILVVAVVIAAVGWALWSRPELREPWRVLAVIALAAVQAHGHARLLTSRAGAPTPWVALQAAGVISLGALLHAPEVTLTLALAVVGEVVALLPRRQALLSGAVLVALPVGHALLTGPAMVRQFLWIIGPTTLFVVAWVEGFQRQARERARAEAALQELDAAHAKLAAYAGKVEALTLQAERQRLARELHDTLSQGLAGLVLQLEAADAHLGKGDAARVGAILHQARERARATLAEARAAIDDLRDPIGAAPTLAALLQRETERFAGATGIRCEVQVLAPEPLAPERATQVQRFVGECLMNVARHARASRVRVEAEQREGALAITVQDDGAGFDPVSAEGQAGHYGLLGLRERARAVGGSLALVSAPGQGTQVTLQLPRTPGVQP